MKLQVHHFHHLDPAFEDRLARLLSILITQQEKIMATLDQLTADVAAETTVDTSVETLLTNLTAQIKAAGTDPVALKALTDQMEANAAALSAAVVANTPAAAPAAAASTSSAA